MPGGLGGGRPPGRPVSKLCYQPKLVVLVQMYPLPEFMAAPLGSAKLFRVSPRSIPKPRPAVRRVICIPPALFPSACGNRGP